MNERDERQYFKTKIDQKILFLFNKKCEFILYFVGCSNKSGIDDTFNSSQTKRSDILLLLNSFLKVSCFSSKLSKHQTITNIR